ncbi:hypothetical protein LGM58_41740 [Burkholderia contaminans]|uniref:hypothetical protein n=1 Tax=Burkholderia contaminans TaxID=488447 RepID=UPI001CF2DF8C|nr:hypothetical protein [Burkholderia contaminans]MCA7889704.1 hypothetical protein [Burkholderia contaminans]
MKRFVLCLIVIFATFGVARAQQAPRVNVARLLTDAEAKHRGSFKLDNAKAVAQMDTLLVRQYGSTGRIAEERDPELKALYYHAATLILNGYPIAGGTLVQLARNKPAFGNSRVGPAFVAFVGAMLQPTDDDDALMVQTFERAAKARKALGTIRPELQLVAQIRAIGQLYDDAVAIDAGEAGLQATRATPEERQAIYKAAAIK